MVAYACSIKHTDGIRSMQMTTQGDEPHREAAVPCGKEEEQEAGEGARRSAGL